MPEDIRMSISFGIRGDVLSPDEITNILQINPTKAWKKGDTFESKYQKKDGTIGIRNMTRPWGIWELSSTEVTTSDDLENHALSIIKKLDSSRTQLNELFEDTGLRIYINIWWQPEDGYGGYTLSSDTVKKLSNLCNEIDFYFS